MAASCARRWTTNMTMVANVECLEERTDVKRDEEAMDSPSCVAEVQVENGAIESNENADGGLDEVENASATTTPDAYEGEESTQDTAEISCSSIWNGFETVDENEAVERPNYRKDDAEEAGLTSLGAKRKLGDACGVSSCEVKKLRVEQQVSLDAAGDRTWSRSEYQAMDKSTQAASCSESGIEDPVMLPGPVDADGDHGDRSPSCGLLDCSALAPSPIPSPTDIGSSSRRFSRRTLHIEYWSRTDECKERKWDHLDEIADQYGCPEECIFATTLNNRSAMLEPNLFPYDTPEGIEHWTLWHLRELDHEHIKRYVEAWIDLNAPHVRAWNYDDNPERSIDIFHVHVYFQVDGDTTVLQGRDVEDLVHDIDIGSL